MLTLHPKQMQAFGEQARRRFVEEEVQRVRAQRGERAEGVSDAAIERFVEQAIARAATWGLVGVTDVQRFVDLSLRLGPAFEDDPRHQPLRRQLEARELSGKVRLDRIDALLPPAPPTTSP